jgi:signal transduction histidine kinase
MRLLRLLGPRTITAQIACVVIVAVLLGVGVASAALIYSFNGGQVGTNLNVAASIRAARIAAIVAEAQAAETAGELGQTIKAARRHSRDIQVVPISRLASVQRDPSQNRAFVNSVRKVLEDAWGIVPLANPPASEGSDALIIKVSDDNALFFEISPPHALFHNFILVQATSALAVGTLIILCISLYAVRWITAPLSSIAAAARSFGRSPTQDQFVSAKGPREIAQVAEALNEMRNRVRGLVEERTQMLVAISHDLRTPLTRLRLRTERLADSAERDNMLRDITTINDMLKATLTYLREGGEREPVHLVDLPSLLQTICAEFTDVGHPVSYEGPDHFVFACRPHALTRAVTNVVDNGVKHSDEVAVTLRTPGDGAALIEVTDTGPGIPASIRGRVFEPFFKGDSARPSSEGTGFGLGLFIAREIVRRHDGDIELLNHAPTGLTVRLSVASQPNAKIWGLPFVGEAANDSVEA